MDDNSSDDADPDWSPTDAVAQRLGMTDAELRSFAEAGGVRTRTADGVEEISMSDLYARLGELGRAAARSTPRRIAASERVTGPTSTPIGAHPVALLGGSLGGTAWAMPGEVSELRIRRSDGREEIYVEDSSYSGFGAGRQVLRLLELDP